MELHGLTPLVQVFDMPTSVGFYQDILGFTVVGSSSKPAANADWVMLKLGDCTMMLNTAYESDKRPAAPDPARTKAHGDTALFFGCEDVEAVYKHLQTKGWAARAPVTTSYGMRQVFTKDPDEYELCFQHASNQPGA
jgi:catechol 2,3-dioxygenase-like lactoylglutathione lyase family enzyme